MAEEIKNQIKSVTGEVLFEYESINNTMQKTLEEGVRRGACLTGADLIGAYLPGAYLPCAYLIGANLTGANLTGAYLTGANLIGANLIGAYLIGADLTGANLIGAYLADAYLRGAKYYQNSIDIAREIIRRQNLTFFSQVEWVIIGQICIHRFCWKEIKEKYSKKIISILKKLSDLGFDEYEKRCKEDEEEVGNV